MQATAGEVGVQQSPRAGSGVRVLILEPDSVVRDDLAAALTSHGYSVGTAAADTRPLEALQSGEFSVVLQLQGESDPSDEIVGQPGMAIVQRTYQREELLRAVADAAAASAGFSAQLSGVNLIDVLQLVHFSRRTCALELEGHSGAALYFEQGELVHAELDGTSGGKVLPRIFQMKTGLLRMRNKRPPEHSIQLPFQMLLLDVLRLDDEHQAQPEIDIDSAFKSYRAPPLTARPPSFEPSPDRASDPDVEAGCHKAVDAASGVIGAAVVALDSRRVFGQCLPNGKPLSEDQLAKRALELLSDGLRMRTKEQASESIDVQFAGPGIQYLARTFDNCPAALLLLTTRSTSAGLARAVLSATLHSLVPAVQRIYAV